MNKKNLNTYLGFIVAFLVMHYTGQALMKLPYIFNAILVFAAVLMAMLLFSKLTEGKTVKSTISDMGFRKTNLPGLAPGIFVSLALFGSYPLLGYLLNTGIKPVDGWQWNITGLMFTAGLAEEMIFRGYLFGSLRRKMGFRKAVLKAAICFSAAHLVMFTYMDWRVALLSTLLAVAISVPLAFLFEKGNNSLWSPAIVHTAIRTVGLVVTVDEKHFMQFSLLWIVICMTTPYLVLIFYKKFRAVLIKDR
jgi:hypothetical protein